MGRTADVNANLGACFSDPIEAALVCTAGAFVDLQEKRHEADYDSDAQFTAAEAASHIAEADSIFSARPTLTGRDNVNAFLTAIVVRSRSQGE
jgi:deferrochelatase/peroxidase EfeB